MAVAITLNVGTLLKSSNKSEETNQKPAGGFLIAHFKRYDSKEANEP